MSTLAARADPIHPRRRRLALTGAERRVAWALGVLIALFVVVAGWRWVVIGVPAGRAGVVWYRFFGGTDIATTFTEGTHFVFPWDKLQIYDVRVQQLDRDFDVLTKDGLTISVNIAVRYRLDPASIGLLHKSVGTDYANVLLVPALGAQARLVFSQNAMEDSYTARRSSIQDEIKGAVAGDLAGALGIAAKPHAPWIRIQDVLVRSIRFPPELQSAINSKMQQYQLREEYGYRLQREELESRRKETEARGIARFQSIVGAGISDNYLRWKGIDATLALAESPNAKIVVIGSPKDGMPLILGAQDAPAGTLRPAGGRAAGAVAAGGARSDRPPTSIAHEPRSTMAATGADAAEGAPQSRPFWDAIDRMGLAGRS